MKMKVLALVLGAIATLMVAGGCGSEEDEAPQEGATVTKTQATAKSFTLNSESFENEGEIPGQMACEDEGGSDLSPQLSWEGAPEAADTYAIVMDDETSPCGTGDDACMHWSVFNIPADVTSLAEGEDPSAIEGVTQGRNYTGSDGYAGPCPPSEHVYRISAYALRAGAPPVEQGEAYTRSYFESRYGEFVVAMDTIEGTFKP